MNAEALARARILVADDQEHNVLLLERLLEGEGYANVTSTRNPSRVPELCEELRPDLLLLDLHMPVVDGFEVMARLKPWDPDGAHLPILVLTADVTPEARKRALALGARDFVTKPFDEIEVLLRVRNLLHTHHLQVQLSEHNASLESKVRERTAELEDMRIEVLDRLAITAEYRDDATFQHARRISRTACLLAERLDVPRAEAEQLGRAATLHDIGKIGVPDGILLKPGALTAEEFEEIKLHTTIGARMLSGSRAPVLRLAADIAACHHERWDGGGYPGGLEGEQIPLAARIVSVADVFDVLTHERPYKEAWPLDRALAVVLAQASRQFDPRVLRAFEELDHAALLGPVDELAATVAPEASARSRAAMQTLEDTAARLEAEARC